MSSYKFWEVENKGNFSIVRLKPVENLEGAIEEDRKTLNDLENQLSQEKKKYNSEKTEKKRIEALEKIAEMESKQRELRVRLRSEIDRMEVEQCNNNIVLKVIRVKDLYSRKEALKIIILHGELEDGCIVSSIKKIKEDIYQLEDYGVFLTVIYYDELARAIRDDYFYLNPQEQDFIENNVPFRVVIEYAYMCNKQIKESENKKEYEKNIGQEACYFVPTDTFKKWYQESKFRGYSITDIKEALCIHKITKCNNGRNDYTYGNAKEKAQKGILFYVHKLEEFAEEVREDE